MQTTMNLLAEAQTVKGLSDWARELGLSMRALYTAKDRGHLSPAIAGSLAEKLGEDVDRWIVIAALESEKDSACKARMVRRLKGRDKPSFYLHRSNGPKTCMPLPRNRGCSGRTTRK